MFGKKKLQSIIEADAKPSIDPELEKFACFISDNYKKLRPGSYVSENKKYKLQYIGGNNWWSKIKTFFSIRSKPHFANPAVRFARVGADTRLIELSKPDLAKSASVTKNFVYYIVVWCANRVRYYTEMDSDMETLSWYMSTGRPKKDILTGWGAVFKRSPTNHNLDRFKHIMDLITKIK